MQRIIFLSIWILSLGVVSAQMKGLSGMQELEMMQQDFESQLQDESMLKGEQVPVGNAINPEFYYPGPGDVLSLQSLPILSSQRHLIVTPEETIVIPRIGDIYVHGMTLAQIKDTLEVLFNERNENSITSVSLTQPRLCLVKVSGNVMFPSTYALPSSYQVSTAISAANYKSSNQIPIPQYTSLMVLQDKMRESEKMYSESGLPPTRTYYSRNIIINHNDGTSSNVDLELSRLNDDITLNPYLRPSDEIIVPFEVMDYPKITVSGEFTRPAVLPYKKGDRASYLLKFGYGFTQDADKDNVYLHTPGGKSVKLQTDDSLNLIGEDFLIEPGTIIVAGKKAVKKSQQESGVVSVRGEVGTPGVYPIIPNQTRLTDIVEKAGGFTSEAYLPMARVTRRNVEQQSIIDPKKEQLEKFKRSTLVMEDSTRFSYDIMYKEENMSVNFVEVFEKNELQDNISLQDGDIIIVPESPKRVYVFGQVNQPGYVEFVKGKSMMWYVNRAGGFAEGADQERATIIRAINNTWINGYNDFTFVHAGDEIYVPTPPSYPPSVELQKQSLYINLVFAFVSVVSLIVTIINARKN